MSTKKSGMPYYYAGGERVTLEHAPDLVAVDDAQLAEKVPELLESDKALKSGTSLRGGIRLVDRDQLSAGTLGRLDREGLTQPVFRKDGATLVALPEVRVEDEDEAALAAARKFAAGKVQPIADEGGGMLTLHPLSHDGRDALALANELIERYKIASASPRFLRVVPGPGVRA